MPLDPHSPEFARLATRWLDGSATAVEAALLWEQVQASTACAREFAEQARFDLLLQDTLRERADEASIAASARRKTVQHHRRTTQRRVFAAAAVLALTGFVVWLAMPNAPMVAKLHHEVTTPRPKAVPPARPQRTTVLVAQSDGSAGKPALPEPLRKRLDRFFLTSISLDKVPLHVALKQLEDQLRALNFANAADLAALRLSLPAEAAAREVTFHSGTIAFLKAVRALAGLGATADPLRDRMAELLHDARALGIEVSLAGDGSGTVTGLKATRGQFEALALLAQSRDQVRGLPPLSFYVQVSRAKPGDKPRILSDKETEAGRNELLSTDQRPPVITIPNLEGVFDYASAATDNGVKPDIVLTATPVGDGNTALSFDPPMVVTPAIAAGSPTISTPSLVDPITAIVPPNHAITIGPVLAAVIPPTISVLIPNGLITSPDGHAPQVASTPNPSTVEPRTIASAQTGEGRAAPSSASDSTFMLNGGTMTTLTTRGSNDVGSTANTLSVGSSVTLTPTGTTLIRSPGT